MESNERVNGEISRPVEVLKAIEKCIHAFWFYVRTDCRKRKKLLWSQWRVEDPKDILLLPDLTKKLQMVRLSHMVLSLRTFKHVYSSLLLLEHLIIVIVRWFANVIRYNA